jgi:hypothetical protein
VEEFGLSHEGREGKGRSDTGGDGRIGYGRGWEDRIWKGMGGLDMKGDGFWRGEETKMKKAPQKREGLLGAYLSMGYAKFKPWIRQA